MSELKPKRIGLALAGGGSYAIFQLGVIGALTDKSKPGYLLDKKVKGITGTSGGAINAVFLGLDNMKLTRLKKFWEENNIAKIIDLSPELLHHHTEKLMLMNDIEKEKNDIDSSSYYLDMSTTAVLNKALFTFLDNFHVDNGDVNKQLLNFMKFSESFYDTFFPFLYKIHALPKFEMQKMIRIYFRELLAKHLLPEEKHNEKTSTFSRLLYNEKKEKCYPQISIFIGATNIQKLSDHFFTILSNENGKYLWKFAGERYRFGISIESILACASVPQVFPAKRFYSYPLFDALGYDANERKFYYKKRFQFKGHWGNFDESGNEIDDKTESAYWDGYFLSNPSFEPLIRLRCNEILLVRLASVDDTNVPVYEAEIQDRKEVLIQNIATQNELQSIRLINETMEANGDYLPDKSRTKYIRVHEIRFSKSVIIDQIINNPIQSEEYISLGEKAGNYFKKVYNNLEKILTDNNINMGIELAEIVVDCQYETKKFKLILRDCITDNHYPINDLYSK